MLRRCATRPLPTGRAAASLTSCSPLQHWRPTLAQHAPPTTQRIRRGLATTAKTMATATPGSGRNSEVAVPQAREPTEMDQMTTLDNGVRVVSEALPGSFAGVGVYIEAGSRFETAALSGASHIADRLAFKSTATRSATEMAETVEALGGNIHCVSSRESMMYQAATFNAAVADATRLLADTVRNPALTDSELRDELDTAAYEVDEIWKKPDLILPELLHIAAFKDNTLGHPLLCPKERIPHITADTLRAYRAAFYRPERTVVAFAGLAHQDAVRLATEHFGDMEAPVPRPGFFEASPGLSDSASESSSDPDSPASTPATTPTSSPPSSPGSPGLLSRIPLFKSLSTSSAPRATVDTTTLPSSLPGVASPSLYTGGFMSLPMQPPSTNPQFPAYTHIHLAFEGLPIQSDDIYALATLNTLLGGGGSFSAGGPGKGMYSRLYTNVLNQHAWVESCVAFNHSYTDSGLFGISALCLPGQTRNMLDVMCHELRALTLDTGFSALNEVEVMRAKNQLRSSLLMNLESRMVELEDLGRQVQVQGRKIPVQEMCRKIENLEVRDLRRVASMVLNGRVQNPGQGSGAPTVVLQEAQDLKPSTKHMTWEDIQDRIYKWGLGRR